MTKKEELRGRSMEGREKDGDSGKSYATIANAIHELSKLNLFSLENFGCNNSKDSIVAKLKEKRAVYHHNCMSSNNRKLSRAQKKEEKARIAAAAFQTNVHEEARNNQYLLESTNACFACKLMIQVTSAPVVPNMQLLAT